MFYIYIENNQIIGTGQCLCDTESINNIEISEEIYNNYKADKLKYVYKNGEIIENPDYERDKQLQRRQELDNLSLTPADVERALYRAKGLDFEDLKALIVKKMPAIDIKRLAIEFRAKDFYRGAKLSDGTRLIDTAGALFGYTQEDMDHLFINKELPDNE